MVAHVDRRSIGKRVVPHPIVSRHQRRHHVRWREKSIAAIARICRRHAGRQRQARHRDIWNSGIVRVGPVHRDVRISAARRDAEIRGTSDIVHAAAAGQPEDAAIVRLPFVFKRESAIRIRRAFDRLIPSPKIDAARHASNGFHVDRTLRVHAVTGLCTSNDERLRTRTARNRRELRQT